MTRPEPAGAGTADDQAHKIVWDLTNEIVPCHVRDLDALRSAIASAITASRRQAKEEDAKIAENYGSLLGASEDIAAAIRSSINPPGEEE